MLVQEVTEFTTVYLLLHQSSTGKEVCIYLATAVCPLGSHHSQSVLQRNVSTISPASHVQTQGAGEMAGPLVPEINGTCSRKEPSFLLPASVCSMCSHCPLLVPCCREAAWLKFWRQVWIVPLYYRQSTGWDHRQPARITLSEGTVFKIRQQQLIKDKVVALFSCFCDSPVQKAPGLMFLSWLLFILMVGAKQATLPQAWDRQHIGNIGLRQKDGAHWTPFLVGFL